MRGETFIITLIKWICWSFVAGVGLANILGHQEYEFMLKMWILCGTFFILSIYLYFADQHLVKYTLIPVFIVLGLASYQWRFDTSNPDHIKNFMDTDRWEKTVIRGTIIADPDIRDWVTHLVIKPDTVIKTSGDITNLSGRMGHVILFVSKSIRENNSYYDSMEYGDRIEVVGSMSEPMVLTNPYGFDYARYLKNKNIYASMYIGRPENIKFLGKSWLGWFGRIRQFSYGLKDKMILGIKKTIPPPASAFIGGVTIGARGGVPEDMKYDFQATGVAHVLALSGLHVGFLAFMLTMFFNNIFKSPILFYKLPSKIIGREMDLTSYSQKLIPLFVIIVLGLFCIITGARPATIRASMMYSIGIVFHLWLGMNILRTGSLTIPISAAIMLAFNSFLIYDASFALSFTAVWSIIYLSDPLRQIFARIFVGWGQAVFFLFFISTISLLIIFPWLFSNPAFIAAYFLGWAVLSGGAFFLEKKFPLVGFEYEGWWPFLSGFFCIQLAIQIGMMWPLSGVYFNRFPVAGLLANFIAIPLIGIIVPLGLIGELFTFIPVIGENLGLAIGATNTLFSNFFLWLAKFFRTYFPYPVQSAATGKWLAVYYLAVLIFAFNRQIRKQLIEKLGVSRKAGIWIVSGIIILIFSSGYWAGDIVKGAPKKKNELLVTFFDVDFGNCILIQTPLGKSILIDGGFRGDKQFWTTGKWGKGKTMIIPNLSGYNISKLDKIVLTNPLPENVGGLIYVINHFNVTEVWDSLNPESFSNVINYSEFLEKINDIRMELQKDRPLPIGAYLNYYDFLNTKIAPVGAVNKRMAGKKIFKPGIIPHYWLYEGMVLYEEKVKDKILRLEVLNPSRQRLMGTESDMFNNSVVLKLTYGNRSFLLPSNIWAESEQELINKYPDKLSADILVIPDHGSAMASTSRFLDSVNPIISVVQFGYLRDRSIYPSELERTLTKYTARKIKVFRTDKDGAIEIRTDGNKIDVKTML